MELPRVQYILIHQCNQYNVTFSVEYEMNGEKVNPCSPFLKDRRNKNKRMQGKWGKHSVQKN